MKPLFIFYPGCSTCHKARAFLKEHNIEVTERDIMSHTPTVDELSKWIEQSGLPIEKFFNTSGIVYRENHLKNKLPTMSFDEKISLLASNGKVIRRPLLIDDNHVFTGFKPPQYQQLVK